MLSKRGLEGPSLYCPDIAQAGTFRCFCSVLDSSADASVSECPRAITRFFLARVQKHDTGFESRLRPLTSRLKQADVSCRIMSAHRISGRGPQSQAAPALMDFE